MEREMNNNPSKMVAVTIDNHTKNRLDKYARGHGITRSALIRLAVHEFLDTMTDIHNIRKGE